MSEDSFVGGGLRYGRSRSRSRLGRQAGFGDVGNSSGAVAFGGADPPLSFLSLRSLPCLISHLYLCIPLLTLIDNLLGVLAFKFSPRLTPVPSYTVGREMYSDQVKQNMCRIFYDMLNFSDICGADAAYMYPAV